MIAVVVLSAVVIGVFLLTALIGAPYVPTHTSQASRAFRELRPVTDDDTILDIGSGDGVVLREALRAGAGRAIGYEINPLLVLASRLRLIRSRQSVVIRLTDFWRTPFPPDVTVVYTFGETRDIARMYARVKSEAQRLGRTVDFISYAFTVSGEVPIKQVGAHYLYRITPLHLLET